MRREIKFRGKRIDNGGDLFYIYLDNGGCFWHNREN